MVHIVHSSSFNKDVPHIPKQVNFSINLEQVADQPT